MWPAVKCRAQGHSSLDDGVCLCRLEGQILERFEEENGGRLLIATLCLLEVSSRGLLEVELLSVLADEDNLAPPGTHDDDSEKDDEESCGKSRQRVCRLC